MSSCADPVTTLAFSLTPAELWDDGILDPVDTRNALAVCLSAAANTPIEPPHYGVFRV